MRLLFLCHGNICRSPMAEFYMAELLRRAGLEGVRAESAALHDDEIGSDIHPGTRRLLDRHGIPHPPRRAWRLTRERAGDYDLFLVMDRENLSDMRRLLPPGEQGRIRMLMEFAGEGPREVADPWYTGDFEATWRDVEAGCQGLLDFLRRSQGAPEPGQN